MTLINDTLPITTLPHPCRYLGHPCALAAATPLAVLTANTQETRVGADCNGDPNSNGFIERFEVINLIRAYLDNIPCTEPEITEWTRWGGTDNENLYYTLLNETYEGPRENGPWWLSIECTSNDEDDTLQPHVYLGAMWAIIYPETQAHTAMISVDIDGAQSDHAWDYDPPGQVFSDYFGHQDPIAMIQQLHSADTVQFTVPTSGDTESFTVAFTVSGLSLYTENPEDLCHIPNYTVPYST